MMRSGLRPPILALSAALLVPLVLAARPQVTGPAETQLQLADLLFADGRYDEAAEAYRRVLSSGPQALRPPARSGLVKSLLRVGGFYEARQTAQDLRDAAPQDAGAQALYADALWASGLFEEAEEAFRQALALDPEEARARHGVARALAARSRLDEALTDAQAALALSPKEDAFHYTLSEIYERMHRFDDAAAALTRYVALLRDRDHGERAGWANAQIRFFRSFGRRRPFEIRGAAATEVFTLPFELVGDKVMVRGRVNGAGVDFVLDTGAEQTVLSVAEARRTGVTPITYTQSAGVGEFGVRGLQIGRIDALQIGTIRIDNVPCLIKNPPIVGLPGREASSFSPLALGLSMSIDYRERVVRFGRHLPGGPSAIELPLRLQRLALVQGLVNGEQRASFVVDTGGEAISISQTMAGTLTTDPALRRIPLRVYGTSGWDRDAFLLPGVDLEFKSLRFSNLSVVVLNLQAPSALLGFHVGGIVGHRFLSRYRVSIDLERSVVGLSEL
jgi:tetratricopeptide (TPR) repeat protein